MSLLNTPTFRQWRASVTVSLGMWALGNALAWPTATPTDYATISGVSYEGMKDIYMFTTLFGCLTGLYIRARRILIILSFLLTFFWALQVMANDANFYVTTRCLINIFSSGIAVAVLVYISEISENKLRSKLVSWNVVVFYFGLFYTTAIGSFTTWQTTAGLCSLAPLCLFICIFSLPETPRCLVTTRGSKRQRALKALQWLRGKTEAEVEQELQSIEKDVAESKQNWREKWSTSTLKGVLIYVGLAAFSQFTGMSYLVFYSTNFFHTAGLKLESKIINLILAAVQFAATGIGALLTTRLNRKTQLIVSQMVMCVLLIILAVFFCLVDRGTLNDTRNLNCLPLLCLFAFLISTSIGTGLLTWVLMVDLCPLVVKSAAIGICLAMYFALGHLETRWFTKWIQNIPFYGILFLYAGIRLCGIVYVAAAVPETKDKTPKEIHAVFNKRKLVGVEHAAAT